MTVSANLFTKGGLKTKDYQAIAKAMDSNGNGLIDADELKRNAGDQGYRSIKVKKGDTLYSLAKRYGTTVDNLMKLNNLKDANRIFVGQTLYLPLTVDGLAKALKNQQVEICGFETGMSDKQARGVASAIASAMNRDSLHVSAQARSILDRDKNGKFSVEEVLAEMMVMHIGRGSKEYNDQGVFIHTA